MNARWRHHHGIVTLYTFMDTLHMSSVSRGMNHGDGKNTLKLKISIFIKNIEEKNSNLTELREK